MLYLKHEPVEEFVRFLNRRFPIKGRRVEITFVERMPKKQKCVGYTESHTAVREISIVISGEIPYSAVLEVLGHEYAHAYLLANGKDDGHGPRWEAFYAKIHKAWNKWATDPKSRKAA